MVAVATPWCVRNIVVSGRFLPFGANSGLSLWESVHQYRGDLPNRMTAQDVTDSYVAEIDRLLPAIDAETGGPVGTSNGMSLGIGGGPEREARLDAVLGEQAKAVAAELTPGQVARAVPARLGALWASVQPGPDAARVHLLHAALVVTGLALCLRRRRAHWSLWLVAVYVTAFHLLYHVEVRYTLPARPLLLVFAAVALVDLEAWVRRFLRRFASPGVGQATAASSQRETISSTVSAGA